MTEGQDTTPHTPRPRPALTSGAFAPGELQTLAQATADRRAEQARQAEDALRAWDEA